MELLKLIIDPKQNNKTCFLCYKCSDTLTNLHDLNEIRDEQFQYDISLWNIMKQLFPTYEFLLNQACNDCSKLIFTLFLLLQRNQWKREKLSNLLEDINNGLNQDIYTSEGLNIKINIPISDTVLLENVNKAYVKCHKCDMVFKTRAVLQKHNTMCHKNTNEAIICDICGKMFHKSSSLKAHLRSHIEKQCPYCSKLLKSHSHFHLHVKNHKQPIKRIINKKYYNCDNCNYKSLNKKTLEAHMNKAHLNIRPYICEVCKKGFYKNSNMIEHLTTHNKFKENICDVCGECFVNHKTLREHLRLHNGIKPFKCKLCNASFINSGRRYEHMARKHKEKNESCVVCGKKFGLKKDLNSHLRTVHNLNTNTYVTDVNNVQGDLEVTYGET